MTTNATPFWALEHDAERVAVLNNCGRRETYGSLALLADRMVERLPSGSGRRLGFLLMDNRVEAVALYLGALRSGTHVPLLLDSALHPDLLAQLAATYRPDWIALPAGMEAPKPFRRAFGSEEIDVFVPRDEADRGALHPDLGLLLSTSGSTGSPKLVKLSYRALAANATSIVDYLGLQPRDRAISILPLAYSFGMSILNTHFHAGGSYLLTDLTVLSRDFWNLAAKMEITSLSGVPSTFEMFRRAGLERRGLGQLRMLTQAGGKLRDELIREFEETARRCGWQFFVMYGQTEAAPRISYVPAERLADKIGSIGIPVPGGELEADAETGELIYRGDNVMMGYATSREELAEDDTCGRLLRTGDIGYRDAEGFFYITGRLKRFIKLSGVRTNLDEIERFLAAKLEVPVACIGEDEALSIALANASGLLDKEIGAMLRDVFGVSPGLVKLHRREALPLLANGKLDYGALQESLREMKGPPS